MKTGVHEGWSYGDGRLDVTWIGKRKVGSRTRPYGWSVVGKFGG